MCKSDGTPLVCGKNQYVSRDISGLTCKDSNELAFKGIKFYDKKKVEEAICHGSRQFSHYSYYCAKRSIPTSNEKSQDNRKKCKNNFTIKCASCFPYQFGFMNESCPTKCEGMGPVILDQNSRQPDFEGCLEVVYKNRRLVCAHCLKGYKLAIDGDRLEDGGICQKGDCSSGANYCYLDNENQELELFVTMDKRTVPNCKHQFVQHALFGDEGCYECEVGYILEINQDSQTNSCILLAEKNSNLANCRKADKLLEHCEECIQGYYQASDDNKKCMLAPEKTCDNLNDNLAGCLFANEDDSQCEICEKGKKLTKDKKSCEVFENFQENRVCEDNECYWCDDQHCLFSWKKSEKVENCQISVVSDLEIVQKIFGNCYKCLPGYVLAKNGLACVQLEESQTDKLYGCRIVDE